MRVTEILMLFRLCIIDWIMQKVTISPRVRQIDPASKPILLVKSQWNPGSVALQKISCDFFGLKSN